MTAFDLHFSYSGGYPPSEASLALASAGTAEMFLGSSAFLPGEELECAGWFAGAVPAEITAALSRLLADPSVADQLFRLQAAPAGKLPMDAPVRILRLHLADQDIKIDLPASGGDSWMAALDDLLIRAMTALRRQPRQALSLQASLRREDAALLPAFQLTGLGAQAPSILLYDPSPPAQVCVASFALESRIEFPGGGVAWNPQTMLQVPPGHWLGLIEQGSLPVQTRLAAQHSLQLPLPSLPQPANPSGLYFSGTLSLWLVDAQNRRCRVSLQTPRQPLEMIV